MQARSTSSCANAVNKHRVVLRQSYYCHCASSLTEHPIGGSGDHARRPTTSARRPPSPRSPPAPSLPTATSSAARHDRSREVRTACEQVKIHMHHGTTACAPSAATSTLPPHCRCPRHASLTACSASSAPRTQAWAPPTRRQRVANRPAIGRPCGPQQPLRCSRAATGAHTLQGKAAVCRGAGAVCGTRGTSPWHALRVARRRPPAGAPLGCPQRSRACGS